MNEKINITKMDGTTTSADIICLIENVNTNKRYAYYTLNEVAGAGPNSTVKIYVSKLKQDNPILDTDITDEDWNVLKGYMGDSLKGIANPEIKYLPLSELSNPVSVSERAIAMPTNYDYINKQRGMYAQSVANATSEAQPAAESPIAETAAPTEPVVEQPVPTPTQEATPTPVVEQPAEAPAAAPIVEEPQVQPPQPEPVAPIEPEPVSVAEPQANPEPIQTEPPKEIKTGDNNSAAKLEPIDIAKIEEKYAKMIEEINDLKAKEIEAIKRYNATIELNDMHIDQHANYVQNDIKDNLSQETVQNPAPVVEETTSNPGPIPTPEASTVEPTPVTPVVPEPAPTNNSQDLETNWFDMPANN